MASSLLALPPAYSKGRPHSAQYRSVFGIAFQNNYISQNTTSLEDLERRFLVLNQLAKVVLNIPLSLAYSYPARNSASPSAVGVE